MVENRKITIWFIFLIVGIFIAAIVSICVGKYPLSVSDIASLVFHTGDVSPMSEQVFYTLRMPRTIMGIITGAALGIAGSVYQLIFKNPLASPDIIGVASGANLGAACAIVFIAATGLLPIAIGAFFGAILAVAAVMALTKATGSHSTAIYVLAGIVINAACRAVIMGLKYFADPENELAAMEYWEMGTLGGVTLSKLMAILPFFIIGLIAIILLRRQIELMALGDNECRALGVRLGPIRAMVLGFSTLLVSSVLCITGLIAFAGLVAPHIARLMVKRNDATTIIMSGVTGGLIVLIADILCRCLYSAELPISILTTIIGVPVLIYFMCKRKAIH